MHANPDNQNANVAAAFDSQYDADEAVLELRLVGLRVDRIGYFSWSPTGQVSSMLDRNHWLVASAVGTLVGAAIGVWVARGGAWWVSRYFGDLDPWGFTITCATFLALFGGFFGGVIGSGISRRGSPVPEMGKVVEPFVIAVDAGNSRDQARTILRRHGGHEVQIGGPAVPVPFGHVPSGHPA